MPIHKRVSYVVAAFIALTLISREARAFDNGSVVEREIQAESLRHSKIGTDSLRRLSVYLPAGYAMSHQQYPVVYMLPNPIGDFREDFTRRSAAKVFDQAIAAKIIPLCIFVVADFSTPLGPSWYVNSPVTGHWDDFAVKELVPYIDTNFRTLARSSSRAIIGNFIGAPAAHSGWESCIRTCLEPSMRCSQWVLDPACRYSHLGLTGLCSSVRAP